MRNVATGFNEGFSARRYALAAPCGPCGIWQPILVASRYGFTLTRSEILHRDPKVVCEIDTLIDLADLGIVSEVFRQSW